MACLTNLCLILAQGHANLLCIVLILGYVPPKRALAAIFDAQVETGFSPQAQAHAPAHTSALHRRDAKPNSEPEYETYLKHA